jgi:hypothetical protein
VTVTSKLDAELKETARRGRDRAARDGELVSAGNLAGIPRLPAEVRAALREWVSSGEYEAAVDQIAKEDPDLATQ